MEKVTYTHKGWFGLCPVYIADPLADEPTIDVRFKHTAWLFELSALLFGAFINKRPSDYPDWAIKVTGKLKEPIIAEYEE